MRNARLFIAEDNITTQFLLKNLFEESGHAVISIAYNLRSALEEVRKLQVNGINLAIVDGNLDPGSNLNADGREIADAITKTGLRIPVVAFSGSVTAGYGQYHLPKPASFEEITEFMRKLPD
jgi:CheY-like chemotaxis protein